MNILDKTTALEYKKYCETLEGDVESISEYSSLGEGVAQVLGSIDSRIELHISSLTSEDAALIAVNSNGVSFERIIEIDTQTARALVATDGDLSFSGVIAAGEAAEIIKDKVEWCTFIDKVDANFVATLQTVTDEDEDEDRNELILTDASIVSSIYQACAENELNVDYSFLSQVQYVSAEALRAIAENHEDEVLDFSWGYRCDENGQIWGREHIEALSVFRGKHIHLNSSLETLTPENLSVLKKYSLLLNSTENFGDEYADSFRNWEGETLVIDNNATITASVAEAIADSKIKEYFSSNAIVNSDVLSILCQSVSLTYIKVCLPLLDSVDARSISKFSGRVATNSRHITHEGAEALQGSTCTLIPFVESGSIYADESTIELLHNGKGLDEVEPQWVGDDEATWQERCRLILDLETAQDEDFYSYEDYPRVTDEVIEAYVFDPETAIDLEGVLVFEEGQTAILNKLEGDRSITLSICHLSDDDAKNLAGIRQATLHFEKLMKISSAGRAAFSNRKAWTRFEYEDLLPDCSNAQELSEEQTDAQDESVSQVEAISFNLGRLRQRLDSDHSPVLGGPETLLEEIEQIIKENGLSRKYAMQEAWIGNFLMKCVDGEDTTEAKKAINDLYWQS